MAEPKFQEVKIDIQIDQTELESAPIHFVNHVTAAGTQEDAYITCYQLHAHTAGALKDGVVTVNAKPLFVLAMSNAHAQRLAKVLANVYGLPPDEPQKAE